MRFLDTDEMKKLKKIFKPYQDDKFDIVKDAPQEVFNAYNKYLKLSQEQREKEIESWFD
jgi:hypothetical protein